MQEEIRFMVCPECLASLLFTEVMEDHEAVVIIGAERMSRYRGYADTFAFDGDYRDPTPLDSQSRVATVVSASVVVH